MVWAWMLWQPHALGTRTSLWFWHGCSVGMDALPSEHERYYGVGMDAQPYALVNEAGQRMRLTADKFRANAQGAAKL